MKVQDEIVTLRQVLSAKLKRENELKTLLGIGFVDDLKQDWNETVHDIKKQLKHSVLLPKNLHQHYKLLIQHLNLVLVHFVIHRILKHLKVHLAQL
jgi:hypothetical protein